MGRGCPGGGGEAGARRVVPEHPSGLGVGPTRTPYQRQHNSTPSPRTSLHARTVKGNVLAQKGMCKCTTPATAPASPQRGRSHACLHTGCAAYRQVQHRHVKEPSIHMFRAKARPGPGRGVTESVYRGVIA